MTGTLRFEFGGFTKESAQTVSGKVVTVTTHDDPETGRPGDTYRRKLALYVAGKPYLMLLPEDFTGGAPDPDVVVFLRDVKTVTVHANEEE